MMSFDSKYMNRVPSKRMKLHLPLDNQSHTTVIQLYKFMALFMVPINYIFNYRKRGFPSFYFPNEIPIFQADPSI